MSVSLRPSACTITAWANSISTGVFLQRPFNGEPGNVEVVQHAQRHADSRPASSSAASAAVTERPLHDMTGCIEGPARRSACPLARAEALLLDTEDSPDRWARTDGFERAVHRPSRQRPAPPASAILARYWRTARVPIPTSRAVCGWPTVPAIVEHCIASQAHARRDSLEAGPTRNSSGRSRCARCRSTL